MQQAGITALFKSYGATVCCAECSPPSILEIPAHIFYRLKDADVIACRHGHHGTLREYKDAANGPSTRCGPFVRL